MTQGTRVLVADDHGPTRAAVRQALEKAGFFVVAEAASGDAAVDAALEQRPDVCLLDIHMPGNGIAAAGRIRNACPETAIVMLTVSRNDEDLFDALRAGASGYLLKGMDLDRIGDEVTKVTAGEAALPSTLVMRLVDEFRQRGRRRLPVPKRRGVELTSREWEVLDLLLQGLSTAEMAQRLFVSKVTVRSHIAAILKKLNVPDRAAAIRLISGATPPEGKNSS